MSYLDHVGVEHLVSKIADNTYTMHNAIGTLEQSIPTQNVTYDELCSMVGQGILRPGQHYRIIDYVTTTMQENTQSAGHQFDVVVMALDNRNLAEDAYAIQHVFDDPDSEEAQYFANSDLAAWELKYCLVNDGDRFAWADSSGKGVIYYMKDEWDNECPYDFKNIQFIGYELNAPETIDREPRLKQLSTNIQEQFTANQLSYIWAGKDDNYKYWEDDYSEVYSTTTGNTKAFYTFSNVIDGVVSDKSLTKQCFGNVISDHCMNGKKILNDNVFFNTYVISVCHNNSFGDNCYRNSFGDNCNSNSFGNACHDISFGNACHNNSFENDCHNNSFGDNCYYNSFEIGCNGNSFGDRCQGNSFGNACHDISFGNSCKYNSFGDGCKYNSFGNSCKYNSFGNGCCNNSLGENCDSNSFGNLCQDNVFYTYCKNIKLNDGCTWVSFDSTGFDEYSYLQNIVIASGDYSENSLYVDVLSQNYEIKIAHNSAGKVKIYCEADLIH